MVQPAIWLMMSAIVVFLTLLTSEATYFYSSFRPFINNTCYLHCAAALANSLAGKLKGKEATHFSFIQCTACHN